MVGEDGKVPVGCWPVGREVLLGDLGQPHLQKRQRRLRVLGVTRGPHSMGKWGRDPDLALVTRLR